MATDTNATERQAFIDTLVESVNLDEWVEWYFADCLDDVAELDEVVSAGVAALGVLPYHWQRREVYDAFTEEVWAAIWSGADEDEERSPLAWLVHFEDDVEIETHEQFVDMMVWRALGIVASELIQGGE